MKKMYVVAGTNGARKSSAAQFRIKESKNSNIASELPTEWTPGHEHQENPNPASAKEVPEQSQLKEKENPVDLETKQLGHDNTPEQMKPERDPDLTAITPKIEIDLEFPQANTSIADEWKKELEETQKLVEQEHSKEMPREQELHQEQIDQLKQQEQKFEKEPQLEMGR